MKSVTIQINEKKKTIVDSDIAEFLKNKTIYLVNANRYAAFRHNKRTVKLHRFIINAKPGQICDHINGKKLDNRRRNLRFVTKSQNGLNLHCKVRGISKFRWLTYRKNKKWQARVGLNYKRIQIGTFSSEIVAAIFADQARLKYSSIRVPVNFNRKIKRPHLMRVLKRTRGKIFSVVFVRREDGKERHMLCRINVKKNTNGSGLLFDPCKYGLFQVYDIQKKEHRFIPVDNVICLTFTKKRYLAVA